MKATYTIHHYGTLFKIHNQDKEKIPYTEVSLLKNATNIMEFLIRDILKTNISMSLWKKTIIVSFQGR